MNEVLVAELGAALSPDRVRIGEPSWRCIGATPRTSRGRPAWCASQPRRRRAGMRAHRRTSREAVRRPRRGHRLGRRCDAARRCDHDRHHQDEQGAVRRPGQPAGVGRAGRAEPRPDARLSRPTACTSRPTRAASRAARSAATWPTTPAARTACPTGSPQPTCSVSRWCCLMARSSARRRGTRARRLRPARRVRRQRGDVRHRHQDLRASDAEPASGAHPAARLPECRGGRGDRERHHRRRNGAGRTGDDGSAVHACSGGVHPRRLAGRCRGDPARRGCRTSPRASKPTCSGSSTSACRRARAPFASPRTKQSARCCGRVARTPSVRSLASSPTTTCTTRSCPAAAARGAQAGVRDRRSATTYW